MRTLVWNVRGKGNQREATYTPSADASAEGGGTGYSFGNPEVFDELNNIVAKFSDEQLRLADSTGFGAFAHFGICVNYDKAFCMWLLGRVDCSK